MSATPLVDPDVFLHEQLARASPDLRCEVWTAFLNALLSVLADTVCGAGYGTRATVCPG